MADNSRQQIVLRRLARVEGQVRGMMRMVAAGRDCGDILVQSVAARQALRAVDRLLVEDHVRAVFGNARSSREIEDRIAELARLFQRARE